MSDLMLFGVLRMPYEMAMQSELSRYQFYQRAQEAADRLEAAALSQSAPQEVAEATDAQTWAELYRLRAAVKGPNGFDTWQDAAVSELLKRQRAEKERDTLRARMAELEQDAARIDWLEAQINENGALHLHDGNDAYGLGLGLRPGRLIRSLRKAIDDASKEAP